VRLSPLLQAPSDQILEVVRKLDLEGVVGERIGSIYEPGERSGAWIKQRTNLEQEFIIGSASSMPAGNHEPHTTNLYLQSLKNRLAPIS
jgi:bifunctional non-homologous end joining protein LigD